MSDGGDDDPKRLIDEEFAELERELQRIQSLPAKTPREQQAVLDAYRKVRAEWDERIAAHPERPDWQRRMEQALADGVDSLLQDQKSFGLDGKFTFRLDGEQLKKHGAPVLNALLEGLLQSVVKPAAAEGKAAPPAAPGEAAQQPQQPPAAQQTKVDWGSFLGALLKPPPKKKDGE